MANKEETLNTKIAAALEQGKIDAVKKHRAELGEHLAAGAEKCKNCGYDPVGMLKTPGYYDEAKGVDVPPVYEVGCIFCPPVYVSVTEGGVKAKLDGKAANVKRRSLSARGTTPEAAVANWNAGRMVEDTRFGVNVSPDEARRLEMLPEAAE